MKMKNSIWNLVWVCLLCSCNSWLDIKLINQSEVGGGTIWSDPFIRHAGCDVAYL